MENPWIRTDDKLPTQEDAGNWDWVNALLRDKAWLRGWHKRGDPMLIPFEDVTKDGFSHWAKLPDAPKDNPYRGDYPGTEPLS